MSKIKEYNAFISYRHTEPDSEIAIEIHKALERFRLPVNLRKHFPKEKWKISRVFRDQDELPIAEDLSESLIEAIQNSEYLIAICTPRYVESKWCLREIGLFKQLHGQDHILAVLADGEPDVSFPQELCYRETEFIDENGNRVIKRENVEPIAADVRGENKAERKRRVKEESIRLAAAMYGLPYAVSTEYALSNALGQYELDVYVPYDLEPLVEDEDVWSYDGSYRFLNSYLDGSNVVYSHPLDEDRVLILSSKSKAYIYNDDDQTLYDATTSTFSEPPTDYLNAAYIDEDKLYMWFSHADYIAVYKYRKPDKKYLAGQTNNTEIFNRKGFLINNEEEEKLSDDGKYKITVGSNRTLIISNAKNDKIVKHLYDFKGAVYGLEKLGNKKEYILMASGKYSYLLNEDFDIKARIPYYYGYEDDGDTLLTYVYLLNENGIIDGKNIEIYRQPLATYDDLIEEADNLLDGYEMSEEVKDRYKMFK